MKKSLAASGSQPCEETLPGDSRKNLPHWQKESAFSTSFFLPEYGCDVYSLQPWWGNQWGTETALQRPDSEPRAHLPL